VIPDPPPGLDWPAGTLWAWRVPLAAPASSFLPCLWPGIPLAGDRVAYAALAFEHDGAAVLAPGVDALAVWSAETGAAPCVTLRVPEARMEGHHALTLAGRASPAPDTAVLRGFHAAGELREERAVRAEGARFGVTFDLAAGGVSGPVTALQIDLHWDAAPALVLGDLAISYAG
jgi:hypothetical protein